MKALKIWIKSSNMLFILLCLHLLTSCSNERSIPIIINPFKLYINGDLKQLREQLKQRNTLLVYENSYEDEEKGIKFFYFDDINDSLYYHFDIYSINDRIKGLNASISSKQIKKDHLYKKVEEEILPKFKSSSNKLINATIETGRKISLDTRGEWYYYNFEIKTEELEKRMK